MFLLRSIKQENSSPRFTVYEPKSLSTKLGYP
jgi:hypothetical protein